MQLFNRHGRPVSNPKVTMVRRNDRRDCEQYYQETNGYGRTDIFAVHFDDIAVVWLELDGKPQLTIFDKVVMDDEAQAALMTLARQEFMKLPLDFLVGNQTFFRTMNMKHDLLKQLPTELPLSVVRPFNIRLNLDEINELIDTVDAMIVLNRDTLKGMGHPDEKEDAKEVERELISLESLSCNLKEQKEQQL